MGMHNEGTLMSPISSDYEKQSIYIYLHGIYFRKYFEETIKRETSGGDDSTRYFVFELLEKSF